ncbi:MAG: FAD-binding oxidoreductase [Aestuariivirga sp.]|uniref:NAD(P)/FAD-dependent oxidoreductase n=1 Tax=Aestuariivirga sp. TaxID=2650926 RepID=UPI0025C0EA4D|nr:FAD-binding oxidoreductase [Aestuariivirga sp.]MCA3560037.1 FAD-binding oxidoreductase [Aestuariivirga sp.]
MPKIKLVPSDTQLPKQAAVCVIGGGVAGVSTALELAERGIDAVLLEKGEIAAEQSSRNWGWCRQMGRDPREIPLIQISMAIWDGMDARVDGQTGFTRCGILYLCETGQQLAQKGEWFEKNAKPAGLATRMIGAAEANELQPGCTRPWKGALYTPNDGRAEPFVAVPLMAEALRAKGGKVFTNCAVRGLETKGGRISSVVTEKGTIACDTVVLAGGAWSRRFCHNLGISLPQLTVINSVMRTEPIDTGLTRTCSGGGFTFRKRMDGGYTVTDNHFSVADIVPDSFRLFREFLPALMLDWNGLRLRLGKRFIAEAKLKRRWELDEVTPFEQVRILDPEPVNDVLDGAAMALKEYYPVFKPMKIAERWAGAIDAMPDAVPVISKVDALPGFHLCTGFSGHGFGLGPGAGKLMAEIVTGETPCVDPSPFRYTRFFDGTNPRPTTGL